MKVLFLITDLGRSGAERLLIDICTELRKRKNVQFKIGVLYNNNQYPELTKNFDIVDLQFQTFSFHKRNNCSQYLRLIQDFQPDIIHTNRFLAEFLSSYYVNKKVKYVCHGHDNMEQLRNFSLSILFNKRNLLNFIEKTYLNINKYQKVPTKIIAISKDTYKYYQKVMPLKQRKNITLLYNGFNYESFFCKRDYSILSGKLHLINVGSFIDKKNQKFIVEVANSLRTRNIDFEINLIGMGANYENVNSAIKEKQLEQYVFLRGCQSNVKDWYTNSDIYIHSAYSEAFGLVLTEAMASGLPVVTLDGKGNRDLIEEGKNGYMIYEQNPDLFADKILEIWNDKRKYQEMSLYAQEYAKRYDIVSYVEKLIDLYKS